MATHREVNVTELVNIFDIIQSVDEDYLQTLAKQDEDDVSSVEYNSDTDQLSESNDHSDIDEADTGDCAGTTFAESTSVSTTVNTYMPRFNCKCKCSDKFDDDFIAEQRALNNAMTKEQLDLVILGRISALLNTSKTTGKLHKHKDVERQRKRCHFKFHDIKVCKFFFLHMCSIHKTRFNSLVAHYKESWASPRDFHHKGRNSLSVIYDESRDIFSFLQNLAEVHALALPGRVPGFSKEDVKVLPSHLSISCVHKMYTESCVLAGKTPRSRVTFRRIWLDLAPWLLVSKPSSDLCWECHKNNNYILRSANTSDEEKLLQINRHAAHLKRAGVARQYYTDCIRTSKPDEIHLSFDYAQQVTVSEEVHYPSDPNQPGPIYFKTPRKCGIFGVCYELRHEQTNYLIDEAVAVSKGSNSVVSFLHHYLQSLPHANSLVLHADNCCGQNKNNSLMAYLAWRVLNGMNNSIEMNFLIAGHTKFSCDAMFGVFKKKFRRTMVSSLDDIVKAVQESCPGNKAQLVGTANGDVLVPVYDWKRYFSKCKRLPNIRKQHRFRFQSEEPGVIKMREFCNEGEEISVTIKLPMLPNMPQEVIPEGLSRERQNYLFKEIREFCRPGTEDLVCPKPN